MAQQGNELDQFDNMANLEIEAFQKRNVWDIVTKAIGDPTAGNDRALRDALEQARLDIGEAFQACHEILKRDLPSTRDKEFSVARAEAEFSQQLFKIEYELATRALAGILPDCTQSSQLKTLAKRMLRRIPELGSMHGSPEFICNISQAREEFNQLANQIEEGFRVGNAYTVATHPPKTTRADQKATLRHAVHQVNEDIAGKRQKHNEDFGNGDIGTDMTEEDIQYIGAEFAQEVHDIEQNLQEVLSTLLPPAPEPNPTSSRNHPQDHR